MKKRSILERQVVSKKKRKNLSTIWSVAYLFGSSFVKFSFLLIALVTLCLLFLSLYQYLLTSPYIRLEQVVVKGVDGELKNELLEISQLNYDLSLLAVNLDELKQRLEKHPWIRSIQVEKHFPHTLLIRAEKERPRALVALEKMSYMNRWGVVFKEVDQTDDVDYPVITGISSTGSERQRKLKLATNVLGILESEMGPWSLEELSEIHVDKIGNLFLYSASLPAVIKLRGDELDIKKDELKKIIEHLNKSDLIHKVKGIDLNYRDAAVISFKNG